MADTSQVPQKAYNASSILSLNILDAIRKTPGMYLGGKDDDAVAVAVREPIDNIVDEHLNGHGNIVIVRIDEVTGLITVEDRARGIPVDPHPQWPGITALEAVLTKAHTGGKFG